MMVRFAMRCDRCQRRSEEYTAWPTCRECGDDICADCDVAEERTDEESHRTLCRACEEAAA